MFTLLMPSSCAAQFSALRNFGVGGGDGAVGLVEGELMGGERGRWWKVHRGTEGGIRNVKK